MGSGHGLGVSLRLEKRSKTTILRIYGFWAAGLDREGGCHANQLINLPPAASRCTCLRTVDVSVFRPLPFEVRSTDGDVLGHVTLPQWP